MLVPCARKQLFLQVLFTNVPQITPPGSSGDGELQHITDEVCSFKLSQKRETKDVLSQMSAPFTAGRAPAHFPFRENLIAISVPVWTLIYGIE